MDLPAEHEKNIFGQFDEHIKLIERTLNVTLIARDGVLKILGNAFRTDQARRLFEQLLELSRRGNVITRQKSRRPSGLRKTRVSYNSLAHRTTWLRSDFLFIKKTKAGQAMLAVSEDRGAAQLMGINVNGTIALTFAIGSGLAAIAGVLLCSAYPSLTPYTGSMPGIKAFVAAVFGGIGSIPGAMIGGILLGVIEIFGRAYISSQMADAIVFAVLIVVLLVKPAGLLGKKIQEKV